MSFLAAWGFLSICGRSPYHAHYQAEIIEGMRTTLGLIEATFPGAAQLIDPCSYCRREEGVFCVPWPDIPANELFLVCGRCLWRKFHEVPRGPNRRAMLRKVFAYRLFGRDVKRNSSP